MTAPRTSVRTRRFARLAFAGAAASAVVLAVPGSAAQGTAVVAGPYAQTAGYATPTIVLPAGSDLSFVNTDPLSSHNVVSKQMRKVKVHGHVVKKPLFSAAVIGTGGVETVAGTANLKPGTYEFFCSLHAGTMKGTLIVQ